MPTTDFPSFAEALYARPGVAAACLDLQDRRSLDVVLLLYAAWLGVRAVGLTREQGAALITSTQSWRFEVIRPLRRLRRRLRAVHDNMPRERAEPVRSLVKQAELAAERALIAILAKSVEGIPGGTVAGNLAVWLDAASIVVDGEDRASLDVIEREAIGLAADS